MDDSCVFGVREDMDDVTNEVRKEFTIKTEGGLNDFLGCEILRGKGEEDQDKCHVLQSHLVRKLVKTFWRACEEQKKNKHARNTKKSSDSAKEG